jgi:hypothetical protein
MKNTSIWFYIPTLLFLILFYGIGQWEETIFWEGDKDYILIFLGLCAMVVSIFIRTSKLYDRKQEYNWINYTMIGIWIVISFVAFFT